ncbi:hypothetical protein pb186bvf_011760 [Paramecium bursaria]
MVQVATSINITFCLLSAIVTTLSIVAYFCYSNPFYYYDFILKNWKLNPITELRLSYDQKCEENEILLSHYLFPGTVAGCNCFKSYDMKYGFLIQPCNEDQLLSGCKDVPPVSQRNFDYFIDPSYQRRFHLCGTQDKSYNFYDFGRFNDCPQGYKKCGSEDYFVCTKNKKCPIYEIGYQDEKEQTTNEYLTFEGGLSLWYNRESSNKMPFVETRIGEADICKDETLIPYDQVVRPEDYPLMNQKKTGCEKDPRYKFIYKISEEQFYSINDSNDLPQKLPMFIVNNYYVRWGLYHRGYIQWKQQCYGEVFEKFINLKPQQAGILNFLMITMIIQILTFIGIGFLSNCISIFKKNRPFQERNLKLNILSVFINLILTGVLLKKWSDQVDFAKSIKNLSCIDKDSDSLTLNVISELADNLESNTYIIIQKIFAVLIISLFYIVLIKLAVVIVRRHKNQLADSNNKKQDQVIQLVDINYKKQEENENFFMNLN